MRYSVGDLPALVRTPLGRSQLGWGVYHRAWPLLRPIATLYRRTLVGDTRVVAVAGSLGKTTTARAVTAALGRQPQPRIEFNSWSALAEAVLRIQPHDRHAVIEVSLSRPGQVAPYLRLLRPDLVVVTSIASEHNRSFRTLEGARAEKAKMVRGLAPTGLAVLNGDDPHVLWMAEQTCARVMTFGFGEGNDVRASEMALDWPRGTGFTLHVGGETRSVRIRLLGRPGVHAVLAAVAVALAEGFTLDQALPALEALPPTPGRLQPLQLANGAFLLRDDYKSALETIDSALDLLAEVPARRRVVVLGDVSEPPGSQGPIYRRLGERVGQIAARAIFVGGNFQRYWVGAKQAGLPRNASFDAGTSVLRAAEVVRADLGPGDVVLIKGRDTQRLDRVVLALAGRRVGCTIKFCDVVRTRCDECPMLERGWNGLRVMF
jgi:UDP-N-acetylmuramoyl-tripeptide--D-alanyl-D-alanine ligase